MFRLRGSHLSHTGRCRGRDAGLSGTCGCSWLPANPVASFLPTAIVRTGSTAGKCGSFSSALPDLLHSPALTFLSPLFCCGQRSLPYWWETVSAFHSLCRAACPGFALGTTRTEDGHGQGAVGCFLKGLGGDSLPKDRAPIAQRRSQTHGRTEKC